MNILDFQKMKDTKQKISMVTCYDYCSARIIANTKVDCVLVGDSVSMVMHGHSNTIPADIELMALHTKAVAKGVGSKFLIADMPFLSFRKSLDSTMESVQKLIQAGAQAVKIEGYQGNHEIIQHIVQSGIPVIGHLGLMMQYMNQLGGCRVQGREESQKVEIIEHALALQEVGCFALLLECIPADLAKEISEQLRIPTIGIGSGSDTDGQVLVLHDMLGMNRDFKAKFLKSYMNGFDMITNALNEYDHEVKKQSYPSEEHCY